MKAKDFDKSFDDGENVIGHLDITNARRPSNEAQITSKKFADDPIAYVFGILKGKTPYKTTDDYMKEIRDEAD